MQHEETIKSIQMEIANARAKEETLYGDVCYHLCLILQFFSWTNVFQMFVRQSTVLYKKKKPSKEQ